MTTVSAEQDVLLRLLDMLQRLERMNAKLDTLAAGGAR
jgi:hypothetical protein